MSRYVPPHKRNGAGKIEKVDSKGFMLSMIDNLPRFPNYYFTENSTEKQINIDRDLANILSQHTENARRIKIEKWKENQLEHLQSLYNDFISPEVSEYVSFDEFCEWIYKSTSDLFKNGRTRE